MGSAAVVIMLGNHAKKGAFEEAEAEYNSSAAEYNKTKNAFSLQLLNTAQKLLKYKKASGELISLDTTSAFSK